MTKICDCFFNSTRHCESQVVNDSSLGYDPSPLLMAVSTEGLSIPLTPFQKMLLELIGISHGRSGNILDHETTDLFKLTIDETSENHGVWLPPGTEIDSSNKNIALHFSQPITLLLLVAGRRSGKTTIASILMAWLARRVLKCSDFLEDVPILSTSPVHLLNVACDSHQATILFEMLKENLLELGLIDGRNKSSQKITRDRLRISSLSSSSRSARGRTACGACFDEFAHFQRTNGPLSDVEMWKALTPSLATFGQKSLAVISTTPSGRSGVVWDLFTKRGTRPGMLTVQVPTRMMNPKVSVKFIESEYQRDEYLSRQEYGAEFLAPHGTFLTRTAIESCTGKIRGKRTANAVSHIHVDIGLKNDATAIAVGRLQKLSNNEKIIVVDHIEYYEGSKDKPVETSFIEQRIKILGDEFNVTNVTFDQHQSMYLVERLNAVGMNATVVHASRKINWESYKYLKDLIMSGKIILPNNERLLDELEALECDPSYDYPVVSAPPGRHDDCADAVAMCAWCLGTGHSGSWEDIFEIVEGV